MEEIFTELRNAEKGVYSMKAKKLLSWFGVLIMMMSTVAVMARCNHANDNKGNTTNNSNSNNNGNTTNNGNIDGGLNIQPTGEADSALKNTEWESQPDVRNKLFFSEKGNTVNMYVFHSVYTVNGSTVSFDFSKSVQAWSALTFDAYINWQIAGLNKYLTELEMLLNNEQNAAQKTEYEEKIKSAKEHLNKLKNPSAEDRKDFENINKEAKAIAPYAKFEGTLNADKTELTIEKCPMRNNDHTFKVERVVFKKR